MEAQTDIQTYMNRGKQALAQGERREAAIAYAHAAQIEPNNPAVHLGLAEANLALGSYGVVYMACRKVQELQPEGGVESTMAQALLNLLDRRYDRALQDVDAVISQDPGNGYAHALRSYLLRVNGQDYDANLARARAARLSYGGHYDNCFPPVDPVVTPAYSGVTPSSTTVNGNGEQAGDPTATAGQREAIPTWSRPNGMQRQMVRTRFAISQHPRLVTNILIGINVAVYLILAFMSRSLDIDPNVLLTVGAQYGPLVAHGEYWRIFTAMFLHFNIFHIGLNMLSLFFIGTAVEVFYGKWRYLVIYLASGIVGGIVTQILTPDALAAGASGAIFGVFGALGVFYLVNRRALGAYGQGAIMNWVFWLGLNLVFGFSNTGIGIWDHIGGLVAGMAIAAILMPRSRRPTF
ncbi:MAG: rhomboid family intramembrane serine protease [Ktedonobacteraceae bacterium]